MAVGEQFVDGRVDDLVVDVLDELAGATRDGISARDRPDAKFLQLDIDGVEVGVHIADFNDGILSLCVE